MSTETPEDEPGRQVVPLHAVPDPQTEIQLEESAGDAYLDVTDLQDARRLPIIPEHLRRENIRGTVAEAAGKHWHLSRYYGIRAPWITLKLAGYVLRGGWRLHRRLMVWWHWTEGWQLVSAAVAQGRLGHADAMNAHREGRRTRTARGTIVAVTAGVAAAALVIAARHVPHWTWLPVAVVLAGVLMHHGRRRDGKPIVAPAFIPPEYQPPTPEIITRALSSLAITAIDKVLREGGALRFITDVHRDGGGHSVQLDLPFGVTATDIRTKREKLASGLQRPLSAVWPDGVPEEHPGRLELWIGRHDLSKVKPPPWPLLKSGSADVFGEVPFGTTPRGLRVDVPLFEINWLIGASPGQGKTAAVRELCCAAALDPVCDLWVHELAGKGDLEPLSRVCHRYVSGLDDEALDYTAESVTELRRELEGRMKRFRQVPKDARPEGKVTRQLASRKSLRLRPLVVVIDEVQNLFMSPEHGKQAAEDLAYIIRLARAVGIIVILATQRPDRDTLPPAIRALVTARFCLKVNDYEANDMILGTGSYKAGYTTVEFRAKTDAGLGWLKASGEPQIIRTYYLDLPATERVVTRARAIREAAGVLTGYALDECDGEDRARTFADDVLAMFGGEDKLYTATITQRLSDRLGGTYADVTAAAVASQLRGLGVTVKNIREPGGESGQGCERDGVEAAAAVRGRADV